MNFAQLSAPIVVAGLAVIAAGLYLLQRLRVRHKPVTVVTTMFWREAVEETRARVMTQRFRHLWAYLFALLIAALVWLAIAAPEFGGRPDRDTVVLVDASARMARGDRFEATLDAVREALARETGDARVILCGATPETVLEPGDDPLLLDERLAGRTPSAAPETVEAVVRDLVRAGVARPLDLIVYSDLPLDDATRALLPADVRFERRSAPASSAPLAANAAITALGVSEAQSGAWNKVDALVRARSTDGRTAALRATLDGQPLTTAAERSGTAEEPRWLFRDLPAKGGRLEVMLDAEDANPLDQRAAVMLPRRPLLRVALSPSLASLLRPVLTADPGIVIADGDADVAIHRTGEATPAGIPALRFVDEEEQEEAFLVSYGATADPESRTEAIDRAELARAFRELGLEHIDAQALAEETARPIRLGVQPAATASVTVWSSLVSPEFDFVDSRAFPIFVARSVRYLAGVEPIVAFAAAGEALPTSRALRSEAGGGGGRTHDPVGASFVPAASGVYLGADGQRWSASLLDLDTTRAPVIVEAAASSRSSEGSTHVWRWLALLAFAAVVVEWFLYRNGRMP